MDGGHVPPSNIYKGGPFSRTAEVQRAPEERGAEGLFCIYIYTVISYIWPQRSSRWSSPLVCTTHETRKMCVCVFHKSGSDGNILARLESFESLQRETGDADVSRIGEIHCFRRLKLE